MRHSVHRAFLIVTMVMLVQYGFGLPRFASRTGAKCQSCHLNPSGGMLRQAFGEQYGRETLPVQNWAKDFDFDDFSNLISNFISVGADVQTLFFTQQIPDTGTGGGSTKNAFFQMQGDLYLNFRPAKHINVFIMKGLYNGFEAFGLISILPANGYIKVGKFTPNFGTRLDDHTTFIRTYTGFSPEQGRPELTGAEIGISPGPISVTGGIYNSTDGFGAAETNDKAFLGRAEGMFTAAEKFHFGIGGDIFSHVNSAGLRTDLYGGLGSFSYGGFTMFGEADIIRSRLPGKTVNGLVTYIEADYVITSGLEFLAAYDFYDPDADLKTGVQSRYSIGFDFFPIAGIEVRPVYRIKKEQPVDLRNDEFNLLIHFYF